MILKHKNGELRVDSVVAGSDSDVVDASNFADVVDMSWVTKEVRNDHLRVSFKFLGRGKWIIVMNELTYNIRNGRRLVTRNEIAEEAHHHHAPIGYLQFKMSCSYYCNF